jgi:hypothetical protein
VLVAGSALCALYPTSKALADLVEPFRSNVQQFIDELIRLGCTVEIRATRRPRERAYLMHYAYLVAEGDLDPAKVPPIDPPTTPPLVVQWSVAGARAMVATYDLAVLPVLASRHIDGRAIDMKITGWTGGDAALWALGAKFKVYKLKTDPPHWSDDGH